MRALVGAPKAVLVLETAGATHVHGERVAPSVVRAYASEYAARDVGMQRQRTLRIEVWSQASLWRRPQLLRSDYYNSFALPHRMHDPIGLAVWLRSPKEHACIAFFRDEPANDPAVVARQLALLKLALPAFKAGVRLHAQATESSRATAPCDAFAAVLDAAEEAFALYDASGRILHANAAITREVEASGAADALRHALAGVARATITAAGANGRRRDSVRRFTTRDVDAPGGDFRVHGSVVAWDDARAAVPGVALVSLRRCAPATALTRLDDLRARFRLTIRESEVAVLLLQRESNAEIARMLSLSPHTARHHTECILRKLGVHSRMALRDAIAGHHGRDAAARSDTRIRDGAGASRSGAPRYERVLSRVDVERTLHFGNEPGVPTTPAPHGRAQPAPILRSPAGASSHAPRTAQ